MCGRFTIQIPAELLAELFGLDPAPDLELPSRYNVAPTQQVAVIRQGGTGGNRLDFLKWGLVPSWAKDPAIGSKMINARCETLDEKPAFRASFRQRRCLVPASGFYEWRLLEGKKLPEYFRLAAGSPMLFAGLWDSWRGPDGATLESCTIVTTAANPLVAPLHSRMPVILKPRDWGLWLDRTVTDTGRLATLLQPYEATGMESWSVSSLANSPRNDAPELILPLAAPAA